ncbi:MAG: histidine phosphatase family protein [Bacillus sp. (in: firmicutes)]
MLTLYLVRHGQTEWNVMHKMQGRGNGELTEKGVADAKALARRLADTPIDKIYSSSSKRAYETAKLIDSDRHIPLETSDDLQEMYFGEWDGQFVDDVKARYPQEYETFWEAPHLFEGVNGETFSDVQKRAEKALKTILESEKDGSNVLVVTHSIFLRVLLATIKNLPLSDVFKQNRPGNTSLTKVIVDGESLHIEFEGCVKHIQE